MQLRRILRSTWRLVSTLLLLAEIPSLHPLSRRWACFTCLRTPSTPLYSHRPSVRRGYLLSYRNGTIIKGLAITFVCGHQSAQTPRCMVHSGEYNVPKMHPTPGLAIERRVGKRTLRRATFTTLQLSSSICFRLIYIIVRLIPSSPP